ncbi:MAG: hypothetical protein ACR2KQ_03055 [Actinomycetota bacterium]
MTRKLLIVGLVLAIAAAFGAPAAAAKKKKKKGPKPYKSEEVTVDVGHPVVYGNSGTVVGLTPQEFINTCSLPSSNGFDAYVWEVPEPYQGKEALISVVGQPNAAGDVLPYDLDIYLFNDACEPILAFNPPSTDESGSLTRETAYILVHNYAGDPVTFHYELKAS